MNSDLLNLVEPGDLRLETLKELKIKNQGISNRPGIYVHIIYNHDNPNVAGIYVGSADRLAARIGEHKKAQEKDKRRQKRGGRERKTKPRSQTVHQKFWAREGYRDFWLCFVELDPPQSAIEKDNMDVILNILEKYSVLLFRSLSQQSLQRALPHGVKVDPYRWVGLNVQDPLKQFRPSLHGTSATFGTSTTSRRKKRVTKFPYCFKPHSLLDIMFRYADPSKEDRAPVPLRCSKCSGSSYVLDRTPCYEIFTGVFLPCLRMRCYNCSPKHAALFVPVDTTMPFKTFKSVVDAYKDADYRQTAKDMEFASRTDLVATNSVLLRVWIRSQAFECRKSSRKAVLVERADSVRRWLEDPQLFNRPPKAHRAPGEPRRRDKGTTRVHKQRHRFGHIEPEAIQSREDLSRLSKRDLMAFVRSRVYKVGHGKNRIELRSLAQEAWNRSKIVRSGTITPEEVRYSADLDGLSKDGLRTWVQSRG